MALCFIHVCAMLTVKNIYSRGLVDSTSWMGDLNLCCALRVWDSHVLPVGGGVALCL